MIKSVLLSSIFLILIITSWSCSNSEKKPFLNKIGLEPNGHLIIPIDSVTKKNSQTTHFNQSTNELCLFNDIAHRLYFFDVSSGSTIRTVDLKSEGPNGIGRVDKLFFQSYDSIFLYNANSHVLNLTDTSGKVKSRFQLVDLDQGDPTPVLAPALMHFDGKNFFVAVRTTTNTTKEKDKVLMKYNLKTRNKEFAMDMPRSYYKRRWGDKISERALAYNPVTKQFSVSYPYDSKLNVFNLTTQKASLFEGNSTLMHEPQTSKNTPDIEARIVYLASNSWYGQLYFDPINEVYLRSAEIGTNMEYGDPLNAKYLSKNNDEVYTVTIVLDKEFNKLAEIPGLGFGESIFSNDRFIYIPDGEYQKENEDIIAYARYEIKNVNK